jgi:hypothetical protein
VLALTIVVMVTHRNPRAAMAVGVGATAGLQTAQLANIHVFCFATALWLVLGVYLQPRGRPRPEWPALLIVCAGLLASTALTGALVNSRLVAVQLLLLAGTSACLVAFGDRMDVQHVLRGLLATTTIACLAALLQYLGVLPYEVYLGTDRPIGLYTEPDWLGMFSAVGLIIAFHITTGRLRATLFFLHLLALLLAAARASWLAVVVVAVASYVIAKLSPQAKQVQRSRGGALLAALGAVFLVVVLTGSPTLRDSMQARIEGAVSGEKDVSATARQQQNAALLELAEVAPWNGLGLSASGRVGVSGRIEYIGEADNNVASNWVLGWWVDGGFLAVPLILLFIGAALHRLKRMSGQLLTTVLICSFFSNAILIPIAWIGLALCLLDVANRQRQRQGDVRVEASVGSQDVTRSRRYGNNRPGRSDLFEGALLPPDENGQVQDSDVSGQDLRLKGNN